ncbi:MAG: sugar phosphate isomerase/epimerase family protein [Planctomycetia bacterium]
MHAGPISRRQVLATGIVATVVQAAGRFAVADLPARRGIKLGFDNFAVRALGWNARRLVDHAVALGCDSVFITDFGPFEGRLDDASLADIRRYSADRGIDAVLGSWSVCPTSTTFEHDFGTAEEHLALGIRMAKALGSPAFRVILGNAADRQTPGGIDARIADMVKVLRAARSRAIDAGVKIAVENHAGDMQSRELLRLVEEAGPEAVGVNFDSGNACWALEDPVDALRRLAPHVVTTSLRDSMLWETDDGVAVQWTAMGEGCSDVPAFFDHFAKHCPSVTVHIETISGFAKTFPIRDREFWKAYPDARASDLAAFLAMAKKGRPLEPFRPDPTRPRQESEAEYQLAELARSIDFCRTKLGLGLRG